jgi:vancomycin resistance protein YoaR
VLTVVLALLVGVAFAGSSGTLAEGVRIAGVDVGGLTPRAARVMLAHKAASLESTPVTFFSGSRSWQITPKALGVEVDWSRAVAAAADEGGGNAFLRGYRRLVLKLSPVDVEPPARAYGAALDYQVGLLAAEVERARQEPRLVRHGLTFKVIGGETGRVLDRAEARRVLVESLASFSRRPVELPVRADPPQVRLAQVRALRARAERVVSAPVKVRRGAWEQVITRQRLARMLRLPTEGIGPLSLGSPAGSAYLRVLDRLVTIPAKDASFEVDSSGKIAIVPSEVGRSLDVRRTAAGLLAAAERRTSRVAPLVVTTLAPERTTAEARAMGIDGLVGSYETQYGGIANRIHNVQLVARLIDGALIAPGATFSFNETTGARTADKGFLEAPVIINGELQTGLGGGVCQVSTTVFNAAYEAGLPITSRTNHALYISHYPLGRDATVDYPGIDLKFVNDTGRWLLLRTFVGSSSLVVNLYGTPQNRRVETQTEPLRVLSPAPVEKSVDESLSPGEVVVQSYGVPAQSTSVHRRVYGPTGKLLSDSTWYSTYEAEPKIVLVGPKKAKKPAKEKPAKQKPDAEAAPSAPTPGELMTRKPEPLP